MDRRPASRRGRRADRRDDGAGSRGRESDAGAGQLEQAAPAEVRQRFAEALAGRATAPAELSAGTVGDRDRVGGEEDLLAAGDQRRPFGQLGETLAGDRDRAGEGHRHHRRDFCRRHKLAHGEGDLAQGQVLVGEDEALAAVAALGCGQVAGGDVVGVDDRHPARQQQRDLPLRQPDQQVVEGDRDHRCGPIDGGGVEEDGVEPAPERGDDEPVGLLLGALVDGRPRLGVEPRLVEGHSRRPGEDVDRAGVDEPRDPVGEAGLDHVGGAADVDATEVLRVQPPLLRQSGGVVDALAAGNGCRDRGGVGEVAADRLDPVRDQRPRPRDVADQRPHLLSSRRKSSGDGVADRPRRPRDQRRSHRAILGLAAVQQAADRAHHLLGQLLAVGGALGADDAVAGVFVEQGEGDLVERRLGGGDLGEDVDAVALLLDHPLEAADLAGDPRAGGS